MNSKKVFYFDVETTGLDWMIHEIVQLAYIIEVDSEVKLERNLLIKPTRWDDISLEALKVIGKTKQDLEKGITKRQVISPFGETEKGTERYGLIPGATPKKSPKGHWT